MNNNFSYKWNNEKNIWLKKNRNACFEEVVIALEEKKLVEIREHPNKEKYPNQNIMFIEIRNYIYLVPFVFEDKETLFFKTMYPSSKATKKFIKTDTV